MKCNPSQQLIYRCTIVETSGHDPIARSSHGFTKKLEKYMDCGVPAAGQNALAFGPLVRSELSLLPSCAKATLDPEYLLCTDCTLQEPFQPIFPSSHGALHRGPLFLFRCTALHTALCFKAVPGWVMQSVLADYGAVALALCKVKHSSSAKQGRS